MKPTVISNALATFEAWLGRLSQFSPDLFLVAETLRHLTTVESVAVRAFADDYRTTITFNSRASESASWGLWSLDIMGQQAFVVINASTDTSESRSFLAGLVADAFSDIDATTLVQWWTESSNGEARTIMAPLPSSPAALDDIIGQLASATIEATSLLFSSRESDW